MTTKTKIILAGLGLIIVGSLYMNWQLNKLWKGERERTSYYYGLFKSIEGKKDSISARHDSIQVVLDRYMYLVDSLEVVLETNYSQISYLNNELEFVLEEIKEVPYDVNYDLLQTWFPAKGDTLEYPFSGPQVTSLVGEIYTRQYTDSLYQYQIDISLVQQSQLAYKDEIITTLQGENDDLTDLAKKVYDQLNAALNENQLKDIEIAKLKKALRLWRTGSLGAGAFIVLVLLLL